MDKKETLAAAATAIENAMHRHTDIEQQYQQAIAEAVHDIKNPLSAVMGYISLMKGQVAGPLGNEKYEEYVEVIDTAANRLLGVCETLLRQYGPEQGDGAAEDAEKVVDTRALVGEIRDLFAAQAEERNIKLDCDIDADFPDLRADPEEMFRAVSNLVSNAVKFTPEGGNISIQAVLESDSNTCVMVVRDSGVGMTRQQIDAVKTSNHTTISPHGDVGTGQGLALANRLIEQLGGRLDIISTENRGTRMKIWLPGQISVPPEQETDR